MTPRSTGELWRDLLQRRARRERIARFVYIVGGAAFVVFFLCYITR